MDETRPVNGGRARLLDNEVSEAVHLALGFSETGQIRCFRKPP